MSYKHLNKAYARSRYSSFNYTENGNVIETSRIPTFLEKRTKQRELDFVFEYEYLSECSIKDIESIEKIIRQLAEEKIAELEKLKNEKIKLDLNKTDIIDKEFQNDKKRLSNEIEAIRLGIFRLKEDPELVEAFKILNKAFLMRYKSREQTSRKTGNKKWRSFQLTFILSQIPTLYGSDKNITLLNFPTGMGKTEAFLGFAILKVVYERLKKTNHGISAIIKYPRKLLSRQQVGRGLELISFANAALFIQNKSTAMNHPISIGTLFNSKDTPNRYVDTGNNYKTVSKAFKEWEDTPYDRAIRIDNCPYCGTEVKVLASKEDLRIRFICANKECIYSKLKFGEFFERKEGEIPIYIGDDEVFRYHPSILITTIDKFSSFTAYNPNFKCLLLDSRIKADTRYGFYHTEKQFPHFPKSLSGNTIDRNTINIRFKKPSLFIFDEIHLLSGSYASKFSIVENAFLEIFNEGINLPQQIICSSATINQTFNGAVFIYQSDFGRIFDIDPEKVILYPTFWDMFTKQSTNVSRIIRAIMPGNYSKYLTIEHVSEYYFKQFQNMDKGIKSLYSTPLYYFKAKARLERVRGSIKDRVVDRERNKGSINYDPTFNIEFSTDQEQEKMSEWQAYLENKVTSESSVSDLVFATSTIANGLDNEAFNLMFIFGFPNLISEYIQARSRIARREQTGLCISFLEQRDVRETSIFYDFHDLHENISLAIESSPTNSEARGVIENVLKKLFHLAIQLEYDSAESPFYVGKTMEKLLKDEDKLKKVHEKVYRWIILSNDSAENRRMFENIWQTYIEGYKRWLDTDVPVTIYDKRQNVYVPQPTLLDISPPINIKLSTKDSVISRTLVSDTNIIGDNDPNEEGDDDEESDLNV